MPGGSVGTRNSPRTSVTAERFFAVADSVNVTTAPSTGLCLASVTVPPIDPRIVCAPDGGVNSAERSIAKRKSRMEESRILYYSLNPEMLLVLTLLLLTCAGAQGEDWPQFLGPARNGVYSGPEFPASWPKSGPPLLWKIDVGQGFSGPVVARGRVILFHRRENRAIVDSLDALTGKPVWSVDYPTDYRDDFGFDEGPRATPAIAGERIYTFGAEGVLQALDFATGKRIWMVDIRQKFGAPKGFFGAACSPLVEDGRVLMNAGGPNGAGVVAFDAASGKVLWT